MPFTTRHYSLEAFRWGELYSARVDRRRFEIIDNQLEFLSSQVGEGRILGWNISPLNNLSFRLEPGMGMIGIDVCRTLGPVDFELDNNRTTYIYLQKKDGVRSGGFSGFSNISSITRVDTNPPAAPAGLRTINPLITYNQVAFEWDANTEPDFSHYVIQKYVDDPYGSYETIEITTDLSYIDTDLEENTLYQYQVIAVDFSGNQSDPSQIDIYTLMDTRVPLDPFFMRLYPGNGIIQAIWDHSPSANVETYRVEVQELDNNYDAVGDAFSFSISATAGNNINSTYALIENLYNAVNYRVTVYSVTVNNIESSGISSFAKPVAVDGAGEVRNVQIDFSSSVFGNIGIETEIEWTYEIDPYFSIPSHYRIIFVENGNRTSEPISVLASRVFSRQTEEGFNVYRNTVQLIPYAMEDGRISYESIKQYTPYLIIIQTVDEDGTVSSGLVTQIDRTPIYKPIPAPTGLSINREEDNSVLFYWRNSNAPYFRNSLITISILDLNTNEERTILERRNVGRSNEYKLPPSYFGIDNRYTFSILPIDAFGDEGIPASHSRQFIDDNPEISVFESPGVNTLSGDKSVYVSWEPIEDDLVQYYNIYRASFLPTGYNTAYTLLVQVDRNRDNIFDLTVENNTRYSYLVTAVDIYGNESENLTNFGFQQGDFTAVTPTSRGILDNPSGLNVSFVPGEEYNVLLEWDLSTDSFDGYEIYRSRTNQFNFELVGNVNSTENVYVDENALLYSDDYYYVLRKYRNEARLISSFSTVPPSNSIIIASIETYSSIPSINYLYRNLYLFEDPIREYAKEAIDDHKHDFTDFDRRIDLSTNVVVENWNTRNFQTFTTETNISGATSYVVTVNGTVNEEYFTVNGVVDIAAIGLARVGVSPIPYKIDVNNRSITFEEPLYSACFVSGNQLTCPITPYSDPPSISIAMDNVSEVDNALDNSQIESLNATQVVSGEVSPYQIPTIRHEGRIEELLVPQAKNMRTYDGYVYSLDQVYDGTNENLMGSSATFYDVISTGEGNGIVAATSNGIWFSSDLGNNWISRSAIPEPVHLLHRSIRDNRFFAFTNYAAYRRSGSSFSSWQRMEGLDGVKIIRNVTENNLNDIFISTDLGVFRLNYFEPYIQDTWEELSIYGVESSQSYGILYDNLRDEILVSNEIGVLSSSDGGDSWFYDTNIAEFTIIYDFFAVNNFIFAVSKNNIYRKGPLENNFSIIAEINFGEVRKISIYNGEIYITTENGIKRSSTNDIFTDININFVSIWPQVNIRNYTPVIFSLNTFEDRLFAGMDQKLFILENDKLWLQYEEKNTLVPTIYVNREPQKLGVYYNNSGASQNISFDYMQSIDAEVSIANQYKVYEANNKGWAKIQYNAPFEIYYNYEQYGESPKTINLDTAEFSNFIYPEYSDLDAYEIGANNYREQLQNSIDSLSEEELTVSEKVVLVRNIFTQIEQFSSQLYTVLQEQIVYPNIRIPVVSKQVIKQVTGEIDVFEVNTGAEANATHGTITFPEHFNKYDDLKINIHGVSLLNEGQLSHRQLENKFELANSGLPSILSQVQQSNINKLGIFGENIYPGQQDNLSFPWQAKYLVPRDNNWYDNLNSTVNYNKQTNIEFYISELVYPRAVIFVDDVDKVFVGGQQLLFSIENDSLEIENISLPLKRYEEVMDLYYWQNKLWALTDKRLFYSVDYGNNWTQYTRLGLPSRLYTIKSVLNNLIIGANDGIYYSASNEMSWERVMESTVPVEIIINPDLLFAVINNEIYFSGNGKIFEKINIPSLNTINDIEKFRNAIYIATEDGLYTDSSTFYSQSPILTQIDFLDDDTIDINHLYGGSHRMIISMSDGSYYSVIDGQFVRNTSSLLSTHKGIIVNETAWVFGYDKFRVEGVQYPLKLSTGVPV